MSPDDLRTVADLLEMTTYLRIFLLKVIGDKPCSIHTKGLIRKASEEYDEQLRQQIELNSAQAAIIDDHRMQVKKITCLKQDLEIAEQEIAGQAEEIVMLRKQLKDISILLEDQWKK